ncbi:hypothetical protein D3C73_1140780 [compost metagenome]
MLLAVGDGLVVRGAGVLHERAEHPLRGSRRLRGRVHPRHRDESAQRQQLESVLGLADALRPQTRSETDHVLADAHAEELRGDEMADLVQTDLQAEADEHEQDAAHIEQCFHTPTLVATA